MLVILSSNKIKEIIEERDFFRESERTRTNEYIELLRVKLVLDTILQKYTSLGSISYFKKLVEDAKRKAKENSGVP